jgi:hypothetical protein
MQRFQWGIGLAGLLVISAVASATPTYTSCSGQQNVWCFASNPTQVSDGATYSTPNGSTVTGTITVYSEQVTDPGNAFTTFSDSTINGLFATNDTIIDDTDTGIGIAPYNPQEGGPSTNFEDQEGIAEAVACGSRNQSSCDNILLLELGSNIASGTTLNFLLQEGIDASGDSATFYSANAGGPNDLPTSLNPSGQPNVGIGPNEMTKLGTTAANSITNTGGVSQFSLTKDTSGVEWVAIEADCHYLLLSSITGTPGTSTVPEPRFYGFLLVSLLGIAGAVYQRRRSAQMNS